MDGMAADLYSTFFARSEELLINCKRNDRSCDIRVLDYFCQRLSLLRGSIHRIMVHKELSPNQNIKFEALRRVVEEVRTSVEIQKAKAVGTECSSRKTTTEKSGGRPRFVVPRDTMEHLVASGFTDVKIGSLLCVSRTTVWRLKKRLKISVTLSNLGDNEIDSIVDNYRKNHPFTGERELIGHFKSQKIYLPRRRLRESIYRVDPINTALRWNDIIKRRPYSVPGPNSLWHIDSNLKLVRWGFYVHGAIDGYSRLVTYAKVDLENTSHKVLSHFKEAEEKHGKPSRVRCDYGGENFKVAEHMLRTQGTGRGSVLTGASVHNQRIERLWRDCSRSVLKMFSRLFYFMEEQDKVLDISNDIHLYCLQYIYHPRIEQSLQEWISAWNSHPMEGCGNMSPQQMFLAGCWKCFGSISPSKRVVDDVPLSMPEKEFGVEIELDGECYDPDEEAVNSNPTHCGIRDSIVNIPRVSISIPLERVNEALAEIDVLNDDGNFGVNTFKECVSILQRL